MTLIKAARANFCAGGFLISKCNSIIALYVESEQPHVAILYNVVLAFGAAFALFARAVIAASLQKRFVVHNRVAYKAAVEVAVNFARRLGRLGALYNRPRARFLFARSEVGDEA